MLFSRNRRHRSRGMLVQVLTILGVVGGLAGAFTLLMGTFGQASRKKIAGSRATIESSSAIEVVLIAVRAAELAYMQSIDPNGTCDTPNPFYEALKNGRNCGGAAAQVFRAAQLTPQEPGVADGTYSYSDPNGCSIDQNGSTCRNKEIMRIPFVTSARAVASTAPTVGGTEYRITLTTPVPEKRLIEFTAAVVQRHPSGDAKQDKTVSRFGFAIRGTLPNAAHLEADGRVTQEKPDPQAYCPGQAWASFPVFINNNCMNFQQLGGGTGLAFYSDRYFGFRPADGMVIDMIGAVDSAAAATSYIIDPATGALSTGGPRLFPVHNRDALINVDDITVIGQSVYFVAFSGPSAQIGGISPTDPTTRVKLCDLGAKGWAQSYEGITALGTSTPLLPGDPGELSAPADRFATFWLKTSSGDFLTALINTDAAGTPKACWVFKDKRIQEIEYKRTYGFDRVAGGKPYYLY